MSRNFNSMNIVTKKNNVGNAQLKVELNRIAREEVTEIRMHNVAKQRFKHKFAKLDVFAEKKGTEPSDVIMYQSHNPGFCYRRNGECRMPQPNITNLSVDFEDIHKLVFTDNELDIEKVLFLYLLSTHRTSTLSPPPRSQKTSFLTREQSPLERLVDRSKKKQCSIYFPRSLPLYILELSSSSLSRSMIQDARLTGKVIINEKIMQLVHSVIVAIKNANSTKYEEMILLGQDTNALKDVARLNRMCRFIRVLKGQNLISSCESFYLISPTSKHNIQSLVIQSNFPILEKLVMNIRKNIFTIPSINTFNEVVSSFDESTPPDNESQINSEINKFIMGSSIMSGNPSEEILTVIADGDLSEKRDDLTSILNLSISIHPRKREKFDFKAHEIVSNMNMFFNSDYDLNNTLQKSSNSTTPELNLNLEKIAMMLNQKVKKAIKRDEEQLRIDLAEMDKNNAIDMLLGNVSPIDKSSTASTLTKSNNTSTPKFSVRKALCEACKHKWKTPLPAPKISKLKRTAIPFIATEGSIANISTPSSMQLSMLIDEEYKRWENEYPKFSTHSESFTNKMYKSMARGSLIQNNSIEVVNIDELHLAKIRQEIKENETRKRLCRFLNSQ